MDYNAINQFYAAKRDDGRWGIANDYTGKSRYSGESFVTEKEAIEAANQRTSYDKDRKRIGQRYPSCIC